MFFAWDVDCSERKEFSMKRKKTVQTALPPYTNVYPVMMTMQARAIV